MKLVIAEKPSVAGAIAKVLGASSRKNGYFEGGGYQVTWCIGHLVELSMANCYNENYGKWRLADLPILPKQWQMTVSKGKEKQFGIIEKLMKGSKVDEVICATDAGREGELIFRFVYDKCACLKPVKRLWISSLEDDAIAQGFANLHSGADFENLYQSALCRAKADWLVGINASRLFSLLYGQTLNIGRVVSPTLAMIVERNANVLAFQSEDFYTVELDCGTLIFTGEKFKNQREASQLANACRGKSAHIENVVSVAKTKQAPKLYDLTSLQRDANKILGFTAQQTLDYAQSLYEQKLITYPRTDSKFLTEDMKNTVPDVATACGTFFGAEAEFSNVTAVCDNSKVGDHHAIIPTRKIQSLELASLPLGESEILKLIALRLLLALGDAHCYAETTVTASCSGKVFQAKGKKVEVLGFKKLENLYGKLANSNNENLNNEKVKNVLPKLEIGDKFTAKVTVKTGKTSPPKNFTDDTLLGAMENANNDLHLGKVGIGTPATRAGILEKLQKTGLVERVGKKVKYFVPTAKGIALITVLPEELQSPFLTSQWEEKLKDIEDGKLLPTDFLAEIENMLNTLIETYEPIKDAKILFPKPKYK